MIHSFRTLFRGLFILTGLLTLWVSGSSIAAAAVRTWDGGGVADTNWNTCANWDTNTCPTSSDIATFDGTSTNNAVINVAIDVAGIDINTGYTGTITQSAAMTIGASNYDQATGTFTGGSQTITLSGNFVLSGGTFTSTSGTMTASGSFTHTAGGSFAHNSGTVAHDGNNKTWDFNSALTGSGSFYNFTANSNPLNPFTISSGDFLVINNTATFSGGNVTTGTIQAYGNVVVGSSYNGGNAPLQFKGSSDQNFDLTGAVAKYTGDITVNKTSGTVTLLSGLTLNTGSQDLVVSSGTLSMGVNNFTVTDTSATFVVSGGTVSGGSGTWDIDGSTTLSSGTLTMTSGTANISGNFTHTAGGTFAHNSGTVISDGNNKTWDFNSALTGSGSFYNFTANANPSNPFTISSGDFLVINNTATFSGGNVTTGTIQVYGNVVVGSSYNGGSAPLEFKGSSDQNFDLTGATAKYDADIIVNKSSGTVTLLSALTLDAGSQDLTIRESTLNLNGYALTVNGGSGTLVVEDGGTLQLQGGETVTANTSYPSFQSGSTAKYTGTSSAYTLKDWTYNHLTIVGGASSVFTLAATESIAGNLTITTGILYAGGYSLTVVGTVSNESTLRIIGSEALSFTNDTNSGIIEYVGDADGAADTFTIKDVTYYSLKISMTDAADSLGVSSADTLTSSLVGYWAFESGSGSTAVDSSGSGNNGTLNNMESGDWTSTVPTTSFSDTYSLDFDGVNEYIDLGNPSVFPSGTSARSMCAWAKTDTTAASYRWIFSYGTASTGQAMAIGLNGTTLYGAGYGSDISSASFWTAGTWKHICLTYDGTTATLYGNGTSLSSSSITWNLSKNVSYIGRMVNTIEHWDGMIDDVRLYSRALTSAEVAALAAGNNSTATTISSVAVNGNFTLSSGTFTAPAGTLTVQGDWTHSGGTFTHNSGTVLLSGTSAATADVSTSESFSALTINKTSGGSVAIASGDTLLATGALTLTDGAVNTGTLEAQAGVTVASTFDGGTASLKFSGSNAQAFTLTGGTDKFDGDIELNKSSNTVTLGSDLIMDASGQDLTLTSGTLDISASNYGVTVGGNWTDTGAGVFTERTGTVTFSGTGTLNANEAFYNVTVNSSGTVTLGAALDVDGSVTITAGALDVSASNYGITVAGGWTDTGAGTFTEQSGTVTFDGTGTINSNDAFENLTINTSGTVTLGAALGADANLTITAGTLDVSASNYGVTVGGNWTDTGAGTFTERTGTVTLSGTGTLNANEAFYNVTVNSSGTVTLGAALDVDGSVTITAGALDVSASNYGITVGGSWAKTGTFIPRSGTVTVDTAGTTSTFSGSTTFYNFTCTTATKPLTFTAGTTQTVTGTMTLTGTSGNLIVLRSSVTDTAWSLTVTGTSSVDYVNVKDSNASGGNAITHAVSPSRSTNAGNNTNWGFNAAPTVASITASQSATGDGNVTISVIVDDSDDDNTLQLKVEYSLDGGSSWNDPTLSTTVTATTGTPTVDNTQTYQVGQSGGYIQSSSGANTLTLVWQAVTDISASTDISTAKIRLTPYDATEVGTAGVSSAFILDRVAPTSLASLEVDRAGSNEITLTWTAAADSHFDHYEIWYASSSTDDVNNRTGTAIEWDDSDDATLATASTTNSTLSGFNPSGKAFKIFAVDDYGNELTTTTISYTASTTGSGVIFIPSSESSGSSGSSSGSNSGSSSGSNSGTSSGETSDASGDFWASYDQVEHWSSGYVKYLENLDNIVEVAIETPTFADILHTLLETPDEGVKRDEVLEFLLALGGYDVQSITIDTRVRPFSDVSITDERAGEIFFAAEQELVNGYPDGKFRPGQIVNRAEVLKMCASFFRLDIPENLRGDDLLKYYGVENQFTDVDLEAWYAPYVIFAYSNGIIQGYPDGSYRPAQEVSIAELAKIAVLMQNAETATELASELE